MSEQENMRYAGSGCPDTSEQDIETLIALLDGPTVSSWPLRCGKSVGLWSIL